MKPEEIKLSDIPRILFGEVPGHFYLEVIFRSIFIYALLMVAMRLMGKRMSSQLSRNEMAAISSLAAAIGIPLMNPDKGILPPLIIAVVILGFQILIAKKAAHNKKFESITQDDVDVLVKDGVLDPKAMLQTRISQARVFSQLRSEGIRHLGMVKRLYFEAGGNFSLVQETSPKPGLCILPIWDTEAIDRMHPTDQKVCSYCGSEQDTPALCKNCNQSEWLNSVEFNPKQQ